MKQMRMVNPENMPETIEGIVVKYITNAPYSPSVIRAV